MTNEQLLSRAESLTWQARFYPGTAKTARRWLEGLERYAAGLHDENLLKAARKALAWIL